MYYQRLTLVFIAFISVCVAVRNLNRDLSESDIFSSTQKSRKYYDEIALEALPLRQETKKSNEEGRHHYIHPGAVTNSHRPQYYETSNARPNTDYNYVTKRRNTLDKIEIVNQNNKGNVIQSDANFDVDIDQEEYKPNHHLQNKQNQIKAILVKILERAEEKRKFGEILPILKYMSPAQRLAMASLVTKQLMADSKHPTIDLEQVKAMFGNNPNITADLMLPIMFDIANMFRLAKDHHKIPKELPPQAQLLRRSFSDDDDTSDFNIEDSENSSIEDPLKATESVAEPLIDVRSKDTQKHNKIAATLQSIINSSIKKIDVNTSSNGDDQSENENNEQSDKSILSERPSTILVASVNQSGTPGNVSSNGNVTTYNSEDLPTAEKLRALNRYIDRNGNLVVLARPHWPPGAPALLDTRRVSLPRPPPPPAPPGRHTLLEMARHKCELFTNSLCLDSIDYPIEAISASIRRNQAAMGALLADFPEISADSSIDGVSAKQENKYTPEHYLNNINRREDGVSAPVGAAGFMCPSTVKYARPQKARATSGQWKYIVNTGEHTQTLRLEKCMQPREPCTYLTDNFKSKCVQVYNYHRLLTWDQQNGLHMDIFKVPTCCSCHIEAYSVSFPPHTNRPTELTSERFPGEDLSHDAEANPFEDVQSSIRHSTRTSPFSLSPALESFPMLGESNQNIIPGSTFHRPSFPDEVPNQFPGPNQFGSIENFHADVSQHQGSSIRNIKKPNPIRGAIAGVGLPSYLEPPSKPIIPVHNSFLKNPDSPPKYKPFLNNHFKRGVPSTRVPPNVPKRVNRRPIRKKTSNVAGDQQIGASEVHETPTIINMESFEDINESADKYERSSPSPVPPVRPRSTTQRSQNSSKFTIKNVSPTTTEKYQPKTTPAEQGMAILKDISLNRRVNYNYHPIIDFFEGGSKKETDVASDRVDSESLFLEGDESDWRPMSAPAPLTQGTAQGKNPRSMG